tara:strand:+ start:17355 stop:18269 length:915 start_codon:yes stop_codon:yes gene_type:complete
MKLIRDLQSTSCFPNGSVVTIGNFDGVHLGHQAVLSQVLKKAEQLALPVVILTFEPQPLEYFKGDAAPARLMRLREKIVALQEYPVDSLVVLKFNERLANLSADDFIQQILVEQLNVKHLVVGDDFQFGHDRQGDFSLLQQQDFTVENTHTVSLDDRRISSSWVRETLQAGDLAKTAALLDRPFSMMGKVTHGHKRGRTIGIPTANLYTHRAVTPIRGVYAVKVKGLPEGELMGVANVGTRPTVDEGTRTLLEIHLFDFDRDIYGEQIAVEFCLKLRDEKRFDDFGELKAQIYQDVDDAKAFFG